MVSIIIPVYNTAKYLHQALDSVIYQTYQNLQIICVNDGSTDNSLSILKEYAKNDLRIEIITQRNSGLSSARNRGLESAKGDYVLFLDSDDWMDTDTVEKARRNLIDHDVDVVFWGYIKEYDNKSIPVQVWHESRRFIGDSMQNLTIRLVAPNEQDLHNPAQLDSIGTAWGKLYRREILVASTARFIDTQIIGSAEDVLYNIEVFSQARAAFYAADIYHHYRKNNSNSLTKTYKKDLIIQWQDLFNRMQHLIERFHLGDSAYEALENRKALALIGLGLNEISSESSFLKQAKRIKALLSLFWLNRAVKQLPLKYFTPHWKLFFLAAKTKNYLLVTILTLIIKQIISK